jgi:hypothetical protein
MKTAARKCPASAFALPSIAIRVAAGQCAAAAGGEQACLDAQHQAAPLQARTRAVQAGMAYGSLMLQQGL